MDNKYTSEFEDADREIDQIIGEFKNNEGPPLSPALIEMLDYRVSNEPLNADTVPQALFAEGSNIFEFIAQQHFGVPDNTHYDMNSGDQLTDIAMTEQEVFEHIITMENGEPVAEVPLPIAVAPLHSAVWEDFPEIIMQPINPQQQFVQRAEYSIEGPNSLDNWHPVDIISPPSPLAVVECGGQTLFKVPATTTIEGEPIAESLPTTSPGFNADTIEPEVASEVSQAAAQNLSQLEAKERERKLKNNVASKTSREKRKMNDKEKDDERKRETVRLEKEIFVRDERMKKKRKIYEKMILLIKVEPSNFEVQKQALQ